MKKIALNLGMVLALIGPSLALAERADVKTVNEHLAANLNIKFSQILYQASPAKHRPWSEICFRAGEMKAPLLQFSQEVLNCEGCVQFQRKTSLYKYMRTALLSFTLQSNLSEIEGLCRGPENIQNLRAGIVDTMRIMLSYDERVKAVDFNLTSQISQGAISPEEAELVRIKISDEEMETRRQLGFSETQNVRQRWGEK